MERKRDARSKAKGGEGIRAEAQSGKTQARKSRTPAPPPRHLRFLHLVIDIVRNPEPEDDLGQWDIKQARIMYDRTAKPQVVRETLLHEVLHVVLEHGNVDDVLHEDIIRAMSPLLLHMLRANPSLVRYLTAD
jgi:hypothetical protein